MSALTDERISDFDEDHYEANVRTCAAHLADLVRVYGTPPDRIQPVPSFPKFVVGAARFPNREVLACIQTGSRR